MKGIKKMLVLKKSSIVTVCLIFVLLAAGYINFINTPKMAGESVSVSSEGGEDKYESEEPETYGEAKFVAGNSVSDKNTYDLRYERDKKKISSIRKRGSLQRKTKNEGDEK